jgi:hypothetical protein
MPEPTKEGSPTSEVKLPPDVQRLLDELDRIGKKLAKAKELGATEAQLKVFDEIGKQLRTRLATAVMEDAKREAKQLTDGAKAVQEGKPIDQPKVALPSSIEELEKEKKRIEDKLKGAKERGVPQAQLDPIEAQLTRLKQQIANALVADAKREVQAAQDAAARVREGRPARGAVAPGPDQQQLKKFDDEMERIRDKLGRARELGAGAGQVAPVLNALEGLKQKLREAAVAAARRELEALKKQIEDFKKGRPPAPEQGPSPKQKDPPPDDPNKKGGGGGGSGGGPGGGGSSGNGGSGDGSGGDDSAGDGKVLGAKITDKAPEPARIYVQSEKTVWAWSRRDQTWVAQRFTAKIIEVKLITKGILAIAENGAAIFDTIFGEWLPELKSGSEKLTNGDAG